MTEPALHRHRAAGLEMRIAIDSTARGPALGGCRWKLYADDAEADADARALASAMTRKAALAQLSLGGGKAVVNGDPAKRTRDQLLAFGEFVQSLGGRYITAADMGTGEDEMAVIAERTRHVTGLPRRLGGCGNPGPYTALGVFMALEAAAARLGLALSGLRVAVQGVGSVGSALVGHLLDAGAEVLAADPVGAALDALPPSVERVPLDEIARASCDVFAPCGPPGVLDDATVDALRCRIVCGAANNPLRERAVAARIEERGILYVPDFLANAGGLIHLAVALEGGDDAATRDHLRVIPSNLEAVLAHAKSHGVDAARAAEELALARVH